MEPTAPVTAGRVAVAVLTYKRPALVAALVPELVRQAREQAADVRVVVVDNDPNGGAEAAVGDLSLPEVTYVHQPRPGIAAARNAALDEAADTGVLVFIDDDETPEPDWLAAMLDAYGRLGGAAVAGPVLRIHETSPPAWVKAARVFDRRRMPTGTPMEAAGTGNLLVDLAHVRRHGLRFDDELGLAGGSDHLFTKQIRRTGGTIHWCDEAVVHEFVPSSRLTGSWTLQRGYRSGSTSVRVDLLLAATRGESLRVRANALAGGLARVLVGSGRAGIGLLTADPERRGLGAWSLMRGAGMAGGALGHRYVEYRRR